MTNNRLLNLPRASTRCVLPLVFPTFPAGAARPAGLAHGTRV